MFGLDLVHASQPLEMRGEALLQLVDGHRHSTIETPLGSSRL